MATTLDLVERMFHLPGRPGLGGERLRSQAASAHAHILSVAAADELYRHCPVVQIALSYLKGPSPPVEKRQLLDEPQFIEALHHLAWECPSLAAWDEGATPHETGRGRCLMGNIAAVLFDATTPNWCGEYTIAANAFGAMHFPLCHWSIVVPEWAGRSATQSLSEVLVEQRPDEIRFFAKDDCETPFLIFSRQLWRQFLRSEDDLDLRQMRSPHAKYKPVLIKSAPLGDSGVRYDPVGEALGIFPHASQTGGILLHLLEMFHARAPELYAEFTQFIRTIHGYELPPTATGTLASFSTPDAPGEMGVNVSYNEHGEPCLDSYCFLWLGHELGHTRHYLIQNVAFAHGWRFLRNGSAWSPLIPRYGRALPIRTLFQIPYVHLYEWSALIDVLEHMSAYRTWPLNQDPIAIGDDIGAEIDEAFCAINAYSDATDLGRAVIARMRCLRGVVRNRWLAVTGRKSLKAG